LYISGNSIYIGDVILKANNGNLKVRNFDDTADAGVEGTFRSTSTTSGNLQIGLNHIEATNLNGNIELRPNGIGIVDIYSNARINGNLTVTGNVGVTGNVTIGGNITIGDALTDNITINASIQSDLIPQADNTYDLGSSSFAWRNIYAQNFFTDNLSLVALDIGNMMFRDNEITTTTGQDLVLYGNGTGGVTLGNFRFRDNTITNISNNAISQLLSTGTGYFKIAGSNGVVLPRGSSGERPTAYAVVGMTRYNTDNRALEVWDGFSWSSPAGASGAVSEILANTIAVEFVLTLG
jgi:hypothetical protein